MQVFVDKHTKRKGRVLKCLNPDLGLYRVRYADGSVYLRYEPQQGTVMTHSAEQAELLLPKEGE